MSDDDLDKLLDEVEKKFCYNVSVESKDAPNSSQTGANVNDQRGKNSIAKLKRSESDISEEIDALLEELLDDKDTFSPQLKTEQKNPKETQVDKKLSGQTGRRKCCPVFVGGSSVTNGVGTATSRRSCDQLRCISCDFRVLMFDDYEWDQSCDYLFLRNNMPDCEKLRRKLKKRRGQRAYACQCSWFSASEPADLGISLSSDGSVANTRTDRAHLNINSPSFRRLCESETTSRNNSSMASIVSTSRKDVFYACVITLEGILWRFHPELSKSLWHQFAVG